MSGRYGAGGAGARVYRRRRFTAAVAAAVVVVGVVAVALAAGSSSSSPPGSRGAAGATASRAATSPVPSPLGHLTVASAPYHLPSPLSREVVLASGGALEILGGLNGADVSQTSVYQLDPSTGRVSQLGQLAEPLHDAAGVELDGRPVLFGGGAATSVATVEAFTAGTGQLIGQLPEPRSDLAAVRIGATAYVLGGYTGLSAPTSVLATTDGITFRTVARLPLAVRYPAVAVLGGNIWVFGGEHDGVITGVIQRVDPAAGTAQVVGDLPVPLAGSSALVIGGVVYLAGGQSTAGAVANVARFDPATTTFVRAASLPGPVAYAGSVVIAGTGYLLGGETPSTVDTVLTLQISAR
ncbi:MAG: Kelch repeat-containing protein [Mycobacteriales bacterium]